MTPQTPLSDATLPAFLVRAGVAPDAERVRVEATREGNINWVRRARDLASGRSWVVKQARPALERFPEYRVSTERIAFEARYYEVVEPFDRGRVCPRILGFDERERVLILEDLSNCERLDDRLARDGPADPEVLRAVRSLGAFLGAVHAGTRDPALAARFENHAMRRLHGDHIFSLPFRPNDFPLAPAVATRALALQGDAELVGRIDAAYARYLEPRGALVHADVQPTNVLLSASGPKLLDAEIAHVGDPAFDVGVLAAHLWIAGIAMGDLDAARRAVDALWSAYAETHGRAALPSPTDTQRYAAIEILRRTIGAARVPAAHRDELALALLDEGVRRLSG